MAGSTGRVVPRISLGDAARAFGLLYVCRALVLESNLSEFCWNGASWAASQQFDKHWKLHKKIILQLEFSTRQAKVIEIEIQKRKVDLKRKK